MANFGFSLRLALGLLPQTEKIEAKENALKQEFEKLIQLSNSDILEEYNTLHNYIKSQEFINAKKSIQALKYKNSEEYTQEKEFITLQKDKGIKNYFEVLQTSECKQIEEGAEGEHLDKFKNSKQYQLFLQTKNSRELARYNELNELVKSDEFIERKNYLLDADKYKKSEEYAKEERFKELSKNEDIVWYLKNKDSKKYDKLKAWNLTFEDTFNDNAINTDKWMNSYFWGEMLLKDRYVLSGDRHYYTDNKNLNLNGNTLQIITKSEKAKGKVWNHKYGFSEQEFDYTSGMLSTAQSFRQKYGRFEAKVKIDAESPVYQAFWLKGEKLLPEIDVFKYNTDKKNQMLMSLSNGNVKNANDAHNSTTKISGTSLGKGFYIYSVDWTPNKISWKINNIEVCSTDRHIPNEPLYIILSAGLVHEAQGNIQSAFEIDWVRCYEKAE